MKALKQKRISLRSLWRRGLVILSLFALVFAACSDSDNDSGSSSSGGKVPVSIRVVDSPNRNSFQGLPVDIYGLQVLVTYSDGTERIVNDSRAFDTYPRYATGTYDVVKHGDVTGTTTDSWRPLRWYYLFYKEGDRTISDYVQIPGVVAIFRQGVSEWRQNDPVTGHPIEAFIPATGLHFTGVATMGTRAYKVDDTPNFSGLTCEADYIGGTKLPVPLTAELPWKIVPYYNRGPDVSGTGGLYITVGANPLARDHELMTMNSAGVNTAAMPMGATAGSLAPNWFGDPGLTVIAPLAEVHHVTGIEFAKEPELAPFFYWEEDLPYNIGSTVVNPWFARVGSAEIKLTYSNGTSNTFTVPQALRENQVWWNSNPWASQWPSQYQPPVGWQPTLGNYGIPFWVDGVIDCARLAGTPADPTYWNIRNPQISFYYRGYRINYNVPVFTRLTALTAKYISGEEIETVDMRARDNDWFGMTAATYAGRINVIASFTAYSDPALPPAEKVLTFNYGDPSVDPATNKTYGSKNVELTWEMGVPSYGHSLEDNTPYIGYTTTTGSPYPDAQPWEQVNYFHNGDLYSMNFGGPVAAIDPFYAGPVDPDADPTYPAWGVAYTKGNNNRQRAVTVAYAAPQVVFYHIGNTPVVMPDSATTRTARIQANFVNISNTN